MSEELPGLVIEDEEPRIVRETCLLPEVVAETVCDELATHLDLDGDLRRHAPALARRAAACYDANERFRRKLRDRSGRETLYAFCRHWLSGEIKEHDPALFPKIPNGFLMGEPAFG